MAYQATGKYDGLISESSYLNLYFAMCAQNKILDKMLYISSQSNRSKIIALQQKIIIENSLKTQKGNQKQRFV